MNIIAFSGSMGSGKSTAIERLIEIHPGRVSNVKFAQPLYDMQEMIYRRIQDVYKRPEDFKKDRKLLQWLGTEWGRDTISESLWVSLWKSAANDLHFSFKNILIVCDDVRFDNEGETIKSLGGKIIRINCERTDLRIDTKAGIVNHKSEAGIDPKFIDATIANNGTIRELREEITKVYESFGFHNVNKQK